MSWVAKPVETVPPPSHMATISPTVYAFLISNPWFRVDDELNRAAAEFHGRTLNDYPELSLRENLTRVEKFMRETYPDRIAAIENRLGLERPPVDLAQSGIEVEGQPWTKLVLPDALAALLIYTGLFWLLTSDAAWFERRADGRVAFYRTRLAAAMAGAPAAIDAEFQGAPPPASVN